MMDKYQELRALVERISKEIIGKELGEAIQLCKDNALPYRYVAQDGKGYLITADCKMDRIGFIINNNIVTAVHNG